MPFICNYSDFKITRRIRNFENFLIFKRTNGIRKNSPNVRAKEEYYLREWIGSA
jgi:hypothetical protein